MKFWEDVCHKLHRYECNYGDVPNYIDEVWNKISDCSSLDSFDDEYLDELAKPLDDWLKDNGYVKCIRCTDINHLDHLLFEMCDTCATDMGYIK